MVKLLIDLQMHPVGLNDEVNNSSRLPLSWAIPMGVKWTCRDVSARYCLEGIKAIPLLYHELRRNVCILHLIQHWHLNTSTPSYNLLTNQGTCHHGSSVWKVLVCCRSCQNLSESTVSTFHLREAGPGCFSFKNPKNLFLCRWRCTIDSWIFVISPGTQDVSCASSPFMHDSFGCSLVLSIPHPESYFFPFPTYIYHTWISLHSYPLTSS